MGKNDYLCVEMSWKGSISRMSDECLMKGKSGSLYFGEYQAGMRKFTLARKSIYKICYFLETDKEQGLLELLRTSKAPHSLISMYFPKKAGLPKRYRNKL